MMASIGIQFDDDLLFDEIMRYGGSGVWEGIDQVRMDKRGPDLKSNGSRCSRTPKIGLGLKNYQNNIPLFLGKDIEWT